MYITNQSIDLLLQDIFVKKLHNYLSHFEYREQQLIMAKKILDGFTESKKLIIEAPTGIGKSLAYLVPAVLYVKAINKNTRVIISTYTKTLQQQLINKDLPVVSQLIRDLIDEEIRYTAFFGSENYVCLNRLYEFKSELLTTNEFIKLQSIEEWLQHSETGCVEEIKSVDMELWQEINREVDLCRGKHCKFYDQCYYYKKLSTLKFMDIIIVNHHLFFANIISSNRFLPKNNQETEEIIVFDEAHNLGNVILQWLGHEVSNTQLKYLCNQIYNLKKQRGLVTKLKSLPESWKQNTINSVANLVAAIGQFFSELNTKIPEGKFEFRVFTAGIVEDVLTPALTELLTQFKSAKNMVKTDEEMFKINSYTRRILNFISIINLWLKCENIKDYIYWVEKEETKRKTLKITLRITPLEIAQEMQEKIYSIYDKILFTSATLCVNKKYDFFKLSVGLQPEITPYVSTTEQLTLNSPFDYKKNVVLYLPENIPDPRQEYDLYKVVILDVIKNLLELTQGDTFVLFTSFELMNWIANNIKTQLKIFIQSTSKYKLLEEFKNTRNAVLFGVDTFWQGVDIPGEKLISIIIPKLPFDVPDHPVTEAKTEKMQLEGKDPFKEYLLPNAIIKLKQGFGRLIRRNTDWGLISILDPRIRTKWYGKFFLNSLPECRITSDISIVEQFYNNKKKNGC
ncbi:MAG: ATP-dependent DNA helicase [Endomicrobia bacterium]|nr:ATP-dependent DNA helicase [Endomicrobiia bacterium]